MDRLERYIEEHSAAEDPLLTELDRATNLRVIQPKMVSGRVQGAFLKLITQMLRPKLVLEIGTFTGYSALSIAAGMEGVERGESKESKESKESGESVERGGSGESKESGVSGESVERGESGGSGVSGVSGVSGSAIPPEVSASDGEDQGQCQCQCQCQGQGDATKTPATALQYPELHTVEIDDELEEIARSFFERSPHGGKILLHIGSALEVVPRLARTLGRPFDMVFIDGDKREYPDYYRMLMGDGAGENGEGAANSSPMVRSGGIILADNVLWYGKVAEPEAVKSADRMSQGILEFNRLVAADPRVENVIVPLRDGINLIRVK